MGEFNSSKQREDKSLMNNSAFHSFDLATAARDAGKHRLHNTERMFVFTAKLKKNGV